MIGHLVGTLVEFPVKYSCNLITYPFSYTQQENDLVSSQQCSANEEWHKNLSTISCTAISKVAHEAIEFTVDQIPIYFGVRFTLNLLGSHNECDHGITPSIIGATAGAIAEIIFDQGNILLNGVIGYVVSLAGTLSVEHLHHLHDHHHHH